MKLDRRTFLKAAAALTTYSMAGYGRDDAAVAAPRPPQTLEERVGQLFAVSLQDTRPSSAFLSLLRRYHFGSVILYANNYSNPAQCRTMLRTLQRASSYPLLVGADQEGGTVVRFRRGVHTFPSEAIYGKLGSAARVYADATTTARDLRSLGLTMNLAPVVDVLSNPKSPIGTRSYGSNAHEVARLSTAAVHGYQQHRIAATAKHFIGLGHTSIDSHQALPTVNQSLAQLEHNDLIPFQAAVAAGVSSVLVAHVALPKIDPSGTPASLSAVVIQQLIRGYLGFRGVIMTDSLAMGAINGVGTPEAAERAFAAGADILLIAANVNIPARVLEDSFNRVVSAVKSGRVSEARLNQSVARILALKKAYPPAVL